MALPDTLTIKDWTLHGTGPIPEDGFSVGGNLLVERQGALDLFTLNWGEGCSMQNICLGVTAATMVHFRSGDVNCQVLITWDGRTLSGDLSVPGDGNAGTFTAESSGPPPPDPSEE